MPLAGSLALLCRRGHWDLGKSIEFRPYAKGRRMMQTGKCPKVSQLLFSEICRDHRWFPLKTVSLSLESASSSCSRSPSGMQGQQPPKSWTVAWSAALHTAEPSAGGAAHLLRGQQQQSVGGLHMLQGIRGAAAAQDSFLPRLPLYPGPARSQQRKASAAVPHRPGAGAWIQYEKLGC